MDRKTRIRDMVAWQNFYNARKAIIATYEDDEKKFEKLTAETAALVKQKSDFEAHLASLMHKIESENTKLDNVYSQIDAMERDRDNLKMSRQIKSWEKDMEKYSQDKEVLEAQVYYDKAKQGDLTQSLEELTVKIEQNTQELSQLKIDLDTIKGETAPERDRLQEEIENISSQFDTHFMEYFNRLLIKNKGSVLSIIEEDSCSVCNMQLPASFLGGCEMEEAEDMALLQCPNCFRYLYTEDVFED